MDRHGDGKVRVVSSQPFAQGRSGEGRHQPPTGLRPEDITAAGVDRSFQITNLFPSLSVEENLRLAVQARHRRRYAFWRSTNSLADVTAQTAELTAFLGLGGIERVEAGALSYGGQRIFDLGLALATRPRRTMSFG